MDYLIKNMMIQKKQNLNKINQMSPAFVNRFDVIVLENQIESLNEEEKKELIKFLLINSYQENKIKAIIRKQEKEIEKGKDEINQELEDIDFSQITNMNEKENKGQEQNDEGGNNDFNFGDEGGNDDFNFGNEGGNNDFNFGNEGENNDFNFNEEGENNNLNIQGDTGQTVENETPTKIGENVGNNNNESNNKNELDNVNNNINTKEKGQLNDQAQNDNKEINNKQNEENEEIIEENYNPKNDLIDRIYSKSDSFKNIYKLNQFCRTIRIFIIYFKDKNEISEESIVNFCYNILTKDFEKGKLIEIDPKIENILLDLKEEPPSDDPKYFYKNSRMLRNYIAVLHACKIANIHLCVYGPPGAGKTSGTRAFGRIISKDPDKRFDFEMHSFHAGTKPSHYYGTTTLKEGKIYYKNGTLTNSLINGYLFIADELNLSSISNISALAPALEMNLNHKIYFPGIEEPILIHPNFFFVVCQNEVGTIGRNTLPPNIIKRFKEIFYPPQQKEDISQICKEINNSLYKPGENKTTDDETAERLGEFMIELNSQNFCEIAQWSLRDINKLLQRQLQQSKIPGIYKGITFCHNYYFIY